jgi:uncharacterized membrane protein HdeD (DUF308 family)
MLSMLSENWWVLALRGLLAVLFGFAALVLPLATLEAVGRLFGVYAILEGACRLDRDAEDPVQGSVYR